MTRIVVVGNGMVGARFVEDLMKADAALGYRVTVIGDEAAQAYNRVLLSDVVSGKRDPNALALPVVNDPRVVYRRGEPVGQIDRERKLVITGDGGRYRYDKLVLATGARARLPRLPGLLGGSFARGVHALRTLADAHNIVAATLGAEHAVVLGGGVLGLEVACGLAKRDVAVTLVHPGRGLMERQLDAAAGAAVLGTLDMLGVAHRLGVPAAGVVRRNGRIVALRLADGEDLPSDFLVLTTGTSPNTSLAEAAGLDVDRGILVDANLTTPADPDVHAIGDCAQPPEGSLGLVAQGWEQARVLVHNLTGREAAPLPERSVEDVVRVKAPGLDVVTMGRCGARRTPQPGERALSLSDAASGRHVEVIVADGRLVGATCVGAGDLASDLVAAYRNATPIPRDPAYLLLAPMVRPVVDPATEVLCRCNGVTAATVAACIEGGAASLAAVAAKTRATTGCGGCSDKVTRLLTAAREVTRLKRRPNVPETLAS